MQGVSLTVYGQVQGVGFRWMTKMIADKLGIKGEVKNNYDGSVYIEAVGDPADLATFIGAVKASPSPSGRVDHVDQKRLEPLPEFKKFNVTG